MFSDGAPSRPRIGLLTAHPDPLLLWQTDRAGIDFVIVDAEQTGLSPRDVTAVVTSLAGGDTQVHVRVPDLEPATLVAFANTGVDEIVLPQVRTVAEVERAFEATRYAPRGTRSRQVSVASRYGTDFTAEPRLSVLVETWDAVEHADALAAMDELAGAWVGTTDLADDLARRSVTVDPGTVVDRVIEAFRAGRKPIGLPAVDEAGVAAAFARGADQCAVYWEKSLRTVLDRFAATTRVPTLAGVSGE